MPDVLIQNCRLRVVRKGGWTWGPDRRQLVSMATQALPRLIAEALSHLLQDVSGNVSVRTLSIRLGPRAAALLNSRQPFSSSARDALRSALVQQIRPQLPEVLVPAPKKPLGRDNRTPPPPQQEPLDFARLIVGWYKDGSLQARLAWFTIEALHSWERALLVSLPQHSKTDAEISYEPSPYMRAVLAKWPAGTDWRPQQLLSLRLLLAADILASSAGKIHANDLQKLLDFFLPITQPVDREAEAEHRAKLQSPSSMADEMTRASAPHAELRHEFTKQSQIGPRAFDRQAIATIDTRIFSALPFLVLGVLHRMGYLRTLAAALELSGTTAEACAFATALAYKLLRPPDSGWRRDHDSLHAAVVFASQTETLEQEVLRSFERRAGAQLSAVDADVTSALRSGYDARHPLVVQQVDGWYLCFDTNGMFPIAFAFGERDIESLLRLFEPETVFMDSSTISSNLIECLQRNSCSFVTEGQPSRGDRWQPLDHQRRWWTSVSRPARRAIVEGYSIAIDEGHEFVEQLVRRRPAIAGRSIASADASLERSVTLAAGAGLAQLAYTLWHDREPTSAVLAFERFHDLEARVQIDAERVRVRLALGRRFLDLREHGFLRDIASVPWLDGRTLEFVES